MVESKGKPPRMQGFREVRRVGLEPTTIGLEVLRVAVHTVQEDLLTPFLSPFLAYSVHYLHCFDPNTSL